MSNEIITSGSNLAIRSTGDDLWWSVPSKGLPLAVRGQRPSSASILAIFKSGDMNGEIKSGDHVQIRGTDNDAWIQVLNGSVLAGDFKSDLGSNLLIDKCGGSPGAVLCIGDLFRVRCTVGKFETWLKAETEIGDLKTINQKSEASTFIFTDKNKPGELAAQDSIHIHAKWHAHNYLAYAEYYFEAWVTRTEDPNSERMPVDELEMRWRHGDVHGREVGQNIAMIAKSDRTYNLGYDANICVVARCKRGLEDKGVSNPAGCIWVGP